MAALGEPEGDHLSIRTGTEDVFAEYRAHHVLISWTAITAFDKGLLQWSCVSSVQPHFIRLCPVSIDPDTPSARIYLRCRCRGKPTV